MGLSIRLQFLILRDLLLAFPRESENVLFFLPESDLFDTEGVVFVRLDGHSRLDFPGERLQIPWDRSIVLLHLPPPRFVDWSSLFWPSKIGALPPWPFPEEGRARKGCEDWYFSLENRYADSVCFSVLAAFSSRLSHSLPKSFCSSSCNSFLQSSSNIYLVFALSLDNPFSRFFLLR